jgi:hypothetical protein
VANFLYARAQAGPRLRTLVFRPEGVGMVEMDDVNKQPSECPKSSPAGGSQPAPRQREDLRIVRRARGAVMEHLVSGRFSISGVELLSELGAECTQRAGDADPLDQLTFRLRQRLEQQLAVIAVVRRARKQAPQEASA